MSRLEGLVPLTIVPRKGEDQMANGVNADSERKGLRSTLLTKVPKVNTQQDFVKPGALREVESRGKGVVKYPAV